MAEFISGRMYARYLRRVRGSNVARRTGLLRAIRAEFGGRVEVTADGGGAHIVLWPRQRIREAAVVRAAAALGVGVYGIAAYYPNKPKRAGIKLDYSPMTETQIREGIRRLAEVL